VVTVNVLEAGAPADGVALAGENEQAAWAGSVPQENFTVPVKPATDVTVKVKVAVCPAGMVPDGGVAVTVKSGAAITMVTALEVLAALF
jgi:hypothetical protein